MTAKTATTVKVHWLVCDDYAAGPFTAYRAERELAQATAGEYDCKLPHRVTVSGFQPTTTSQLTASRRRWQETALAAGPDADLAAEFAAHVADILAADIGTSDGELTVAQTGWSKERGAAADAAADPGSLAWIAALGVHERVTLTADGRAVETSTWCRCSPEPAGERWVQYQRWDTTGMAAHGFACPQCRHLVQSG